MPSQIDSVSINGFRSLAEVKIDQLPQAVVMVGANGSGKSNFIRFFEMVQQMLNEHKLGMFVSDQGGADDQLFGGAITSKQIEARISIRNRVGISQYHFQLAHAQPDRLQFAKELFRFVEEEYRETLFEKGQYSNSELGWQDLGNGHTEAQISEVASLHLSNSHADNCEWKGHCRAAKEVVNLFAKSSIFQFHDTSDTSRMKVKWDIHDSLSLRPDGGNLASVLYKLERENPLEYKSIHRDISQILPDFGGFAIQEEKGKVILRWKSLGTGKILGAHLTSDGSLRFFALATLLNLPYEMLPNVIFLDEPELGLHPSAICLIGSMIKTLSQETQVILATQSPLLVDEFDLDRIIVFDLKNGKTCLRQLDEKDYSYWLEEYSTGQLWQKNVIGGRP